MQLHQIKPIHNLKRRKRVGRGGKRGTYSGKGLKGQSSRAGRKFQPAIRELIKKYPKLRGYRAKRMGKKIVALDIKDIVLKFEESEIISPKTLLEKRLIRRIEGKEPQVKILGQGEIKKKLTFKDCLFSKSAKDKIEKARGKIK